MLFFFSCTNTHKEIVAEFDGNQITLNELSQLTKQEIFDLLNMAYDIKIKALDDLIKYRLLEREARNKSLSLTKYLDWYVDTQIVNHKDSLMRLYGIAGTQTTFAKDTLYTSSTQDMEGKLSLNTKLRSLLIQNLADSLYSKTEIKRYIYPPKQPQCVITDMNIHYRGNLASQVSFIVASDFNCERCIRFEETLNKIYTKYKKQVKFGFINFADSPTLAALACEAAAKQNKFWEFHDSIFMHKGLADSTFIFNIAKNEELDMKQFKQDLASPENYANIERTIDTLIKKGIFATPTIIINNRLVYITNSYEELSKLLDNELI